MTIAPAQPRSAAPVTDDEIAAYRRDGVVCIRGALDQAWVARLCDAIVRVEDNPGPFRERYSPDDPGMFLSEKFLWTFDDDFRAYVFDSPVAEIAARLMNANKLNIFYDHLMIKEPGAVSPTPWHQDMNYWPAEGRQICTVWVPLDRAKRDNGGLEFIPGSHLWDRRFQPFDFRATDAVETSEFEALPDIEAERDKYRFVAWDMEPGDAVIFDGLVLHGAKGNTTTASRRRALATRWAGDDVRFIRRKKMIRLLRDPGLAPGDRMDCDLFPVVWRRGA